MTNFNYVHDLRHRIAAALRGFADPRIARAWRNRSPVTRSDWIGRTRAALGDICTPLEILQITPCLYAACADAATDGVFVGTDMRPLNWCLIARHFQGHLKAKPDTALTRVEFEQLHPLTGNGTKGRRR